LQCVAVWCSKEHEIRRGAVCVAECCGVLRRVAVCCSVLQCVAASKMR